MQPDTVRPLGSDAVTASPRTVLNSVGPNLDPVRLARSPITLHSVLLALLRIWFLNRDRALWAFMSGNESANPLCALNVDDCREPAATANTFRTQILDIARQIGEAEDGRSQSAIIRDAIDELLASETPRFQLSVDEIAGSF